MTREQKPGIGRPLNLEHGVSVGLMIFVLKKGSKEIFPACHTTAALQIWSRAFECRSLSRGTSKVVQRVKVLDTKPDNPNLIPRTQMLEREN